MPYIVTTTTHDGYAYTLSEARKIATLAEAYAELVAARARAHGFPVVVVDGSASVAEVAGVVTELWR